MPAVEKPYIERSPRDLITAEDWNQMQRLIKDDIKAQVQKALEELMSVPKSGDAAKLEGKSRSELAQEIIESATQLFNRRTGYMRVFKRLSQEETLIEHELHDYPVVDAYELQWFDVICSEDDSKSKVKTTFFLYHSSEKRLRVRVDGEMLDAEIEPSGGVWKVPFAQLLELYKVSYDGDSTLGDLETEFWRAFFSGTNDSFDDDHYCHSPWFDRCCGEKRTVAELKRRGDWDDLWLQTRPIKPVSVNAVPAGSAESPEAPDKARLDVVIHQYDFDKLGASLSGAPEFPGPSKAGEAAMPSHLTGELPVMLLLKV